MTSPARLLAALLGALLGVALAPGCASTSADVRPAARPDRRPASPAVASRVPSPPSAPGREARLAIDAASALVGRRAVAVDGVDYGPGCTALVRASLQKAGHPLPGDVKDARRLYALAEQRGALRGGRRLQAGDVLFLSDRPGGIPLHAGLVARTDPDGTALVLHRLARGVVRLRVNLAWPQKTNDPSTGRLVNDTLYVGKSPAPAGSLVVGAADLLR